MPSGIGMMHGENDLSGRQKRVLAAIVDEYVLKAEPISSKIISQNPRVDASSATIRNTMAELEDLGFLEQPHTSAGRMPTDRGYRAYVDDLTHYGEVSPEEKRTIDAEIAQPGDDNEIMANIAKVLGRLTNLLGLSLSPSFKEEAFEQISLVPLAETKIMLVLSASDMVFRTLLLESALETSIYRLEAIARKVNAIMRGKPVSFLNTFLRTESQNPNSTEELRALQFMDRSISKLIREQLEHAMQYFGTKNMLMQPEFEKFDALAPILDMLESREILVRFLRDLSQRDGVQVTIGEEIENGKTFHSVAVITSTYKQGGASGVVGVIGPKRMPYAKVIPLVDYAAKSLTRMHAAQEKP